MPGPLEAGERVLLIDPKERRYLLTLVAGATFHTHAGVLAHDDIIGSTEGCTVSRLHRALLPRVCARR